MNRHTHISGFSIIEILVGIFVFSLGITAIYSIILSSLNLNTYNKNFIVASNLAREQLELARNIRDSNYRTIHKYNQINPKLSYTNTDNFFEPGNYYTLENYF
ncbi:MAG: hypothetical protein H6767_07450 [Candidatus Peribacteria bacterium]|nr:MAG: hypothetical protein H6767_07450 [Candidatus Peribacteria bacterium]